MSTFSKVVPLSIFCRNVDKILEELTQYARECAAVSNAMSKSSDVD